MDILKPIHPDYVSNGIDTIIWIHPTVSTVRERRVLRRIEEALQIWSSVPTSKLRFNQQVVRYDEPVCTFPAWRLPSQLLIIVHHTGLTPVHQDDLMDYTGGGTGNGQPGHVRGVPADADWKNPGQLTVLIHEIGHAIGLWHTSLGNPLIVDGHPIMHWSSSNIDRPELTLDDVCAINVAYPAKLLLPTAHNLTVPRPSAVKGICVSGNPLQAVSGVHVVVNRLEGETAIPVASRLSGPRATGTFGQGPGRFQFVGLPPGNYRIDFLDASTVAKNHNRLNANCQGIHPQDGNSIRLLSGFQADNFQAPSLFIRVNQSQNLTLSPVNLSIQPISISEYHMGVSVVEGNRLVSSYTTIQNNKLPTATVDIPYSIWLPVSGGVRPVGLIVEQLPPSLQIYVRADPRPMMDSLYGKQFIQLSGVFTTGGEKHRVSFELEDSHGNRVQFNYRFAVV